MDSVQLSLLSSASPIKIDLHNKPNMENSWDIDPDKYQKVFPDRVYRFSLNNIDASAIESIAVYINDEEEMIERNGHVFEFKAQHIQNYCVFKNRFGFVTITIVLEYWDGTVETLYSDYLSIMIRKDYEAKSIERMLDYVYRKQESLMANGSIGSRAQSDIKRNHYINLGTRITLAESILRSYKDCVGFFSANSRYKTKVIETIDDIEKLQSISPKTLQYIVSHPGHLRESNQITEIKQGKKNYVPQRTLIQKNAYTYDIYENQVIVGFTRKMLSDIEKMLEEIDALLSRQDSIYKTDEDYIHSAYFIFHRTERALRDNRERLRQLSKEFASINNLYKKILPAKEEIITQIPKPSSIFLAVPQYNIIFNLIHKWFEFGIYNLEQERFMMSFMNITSLYEVYVLAKMIETFNMSGYELVDQYRHQYRTHERSQYKNTFCDNTFHFKKGDNEITLYYQPVIYNSDYRPSNGIHLYRNNTLGSNGTGSYYYTPDYLIKNSNLFHTGYYIADAKLSSKNHIRSRLAKEMGFKYLTSISPRDNSDLKGLFLFYGAVEPSDNNESIYDKEQVNRPITPAFNMIPIAAGINEDKHVLNIASILQ